MTKKNVNHTQTRVLLLNPPWRELVIRDYYCCFTSKSGYLWPPIDLLILSGNLKSHTELKVIDSIADRFGYKETMKSIENFNPDIIISMTGTVSWKEDFDFFENIIKTTKSKLFVSGNITLFKPKYFLNKYPFLSGILHNFITDDILYFLGAKKKLPSSISYRKGKRIILGKRNESLINNFTYPTPAHELFPLNRYRTPIAKRSPITTLITSFGCPFNCDFCIGSTLNIKFREINNIIDELEYLDKVKVKEIFFEDQTFNANIQRLQELCIKMIKRGFDFSWSCNIHSKLVDKKTLSLMKKAGCHTVQIGIESSDPEILKKHCPTKEKKQIEKAFQLCKQVGLNTLGYFIIGLPGETLNTARQTISFAKQLNPTYASFSVATPDYGTSLRREVLKNKWTNTKNNDFDPSGGAVLETPFLLKEKANSLVKKAYRSFYLRPSYIVKLLYSKRSGRKINEIINEGIRLIKKKI